MRPFLAGLFFLLACAGVTWGQARGEVRAIGFSGMYRPDCWTPMLVHLESTLSEPVEYQIQVQQEDLDKDIVVYTRNITLNPQAKQDFWVYFIPKPTNGGLTGSGATQLGDLLRVYLYDKKGTTRITHIPLQQQGLSPRSLDSRIDPGAINARSSRLVLCIVGELAVLRGTTEYTGATGVMEDMNLLTLPVSALPDNVLGYQAIDAIIWLDEDPKVLGAGSASLMDVLQQYVRGGGHLVVCQPRQPSWLAAFAEMLPVQVYDAGGDWAIEVRGKPDLEPLPTLAQPRFLLAREAMLRRAGAWKFVSGRRESWEFGKAKARPDALVTQWITWPPPPSPATMPATAPAIGPTTGPATMPATAPAPPPPELTPFIARRAYGLGAVTWVAQNLGDPTLGGDPSVKEGATAGWHHIWDAVLGLNAGTRNSMDLADLPPIVRGEHPDALIYNSSNGEPVDVGSSLLKGMEHGARGTALIALAIIFFIVYWALAGPGSYFFLSARKRKGLSWTAFAVIALIATAVTVGVVRLVLRGSPEAKHVTVVRMVPTLDGPDGSPRFHAEMHSRIGLYIPSDGAQEIAVTGTTAGEVAYVAPYPMNPFQMKDAAFVDQARYTVDTGQFTSGKPVAVDIPYRSTLKKLQAHWTGTVQEGFVGSPRLVPIRIGAPGQPNGGTITGALTNRTGRPLRHVYLAFDYKGADRVLFLESWPKDAVIDLETNYNQAKTVKARETWRHLSNEKRLVGSMREWSRFWYVDLDHAPESIAYYDDDKNYPRSLPLLSFYERVGPDIGLLDRDWRRYEIIRRGGRDLDMSPLLAAGQLVIIAQADGPLPLPMQVNGDKLEGEGVTIYQAALPIDRTGLDPPPPPATQPAKKE